MGDYISFKKINCKYIILVFGSILANIATYFAFLLFENNKQKYIENYKENNKILKSFLKYLGYCYLIIGEIMRKKFDTKINDAPVTNLVKIKDIILIITVTLIALTDEFLAIFIKIKTYILITLDERYNFPLFIFLFISSILIFKMRYYNHQFISIIIIILLEIIRSIFKILFKNIKNEGKNINTFDEFLFQLLRASLQSIFFGYSKVLMEFKFFSPFKVTYTFGLISLLIAFIIYIIFSYITVDENKSYCFVKYNNNCYIDNFYSIFSNFTFIQFFGLFIYSILFAAINVLFNFIIKDYTICHIFLSYQLFAFETCFELENNTILSIIINIISILIEIFITLVFLEIIQLKFCGLDKNIRENIQKRAILDYENVQDRKSNLPDAYIDENYITNYKELEEQTQKNNFSGQNLY